MKKKKRTKKTTKKSSSKPLSPRQRVVFRFLALVATPVVFLLLLELVLRVIGYGIPSEYFVKWNSNGETVYIANEKYTQHFVPPALSRSPEFTALLPKKDSSVRILVLGGSAAYGDPDPAFGFCRLLETLLNEHSEGTSFEVINAGITSMNSFVAKNIAADSAGHGIDVFLVYMGNNEIVGPYGPSSVSNALSSKPAFLDAAIWFKKETSLGQLLKNLAYASGGKTKQDKKWMGMEAFLENLVTHDDPRLEQSYGNFQRNLESILASARKQNALAIVSTVPTNLRSCAPFASQHRKNIEPSEMEEWQTHFQSGRTFELSANFEEALIEYQQAAVIDADYADLLFSIARCQESLGQFDVSKKSYRQARDLDALRFRADSRINSIVRELCQEASGEGVRLLDLETVIAEAAVNGISGERTFFDHVHLNFRGNFIAALSAMNTLRDALSSTEISPVSDSIDELYESCRKALLYDGVAEYDNLMTMYLRKAIPPFTGQLEHDAELESLLNQLIEDRSYLKEYTLDLETQQQELSKEPADVYLLARYTDSLVASGNIPRALTAYEASLSIEPYNKELIIGYGKLLTRSGAEDRALSVLTAPLTPFHQNRKEALFVIGTEYVYTREVKKAQQIFEELNRNDPDEIEYLVNLAAAASNLKDYDSERKYLERALEIDPESRQAMINYGNYFIRQDQPEEAKKWFKKAVDAYPYEYLSQFGLGMQELQTGEGEAGVRHLSEAVKLKPDLVEGYRILARIAQTLENDDAAQRYSRLAEIFSEPIKPF